jgi:hypothetical protein
MHQLLLQELEFDFQPEKPSSVVAIATLCLMNPKVHQWLFNH